MKWILPLVALAILAPWTHSFFKLLLTGCETPLGFFYLMNSAGSVSFGFNPDYRSGFVYHHDVFEKSAGDGPEGPEETLTNALAGRFDLEFEPTSGPFWFFLATVPYWFLFVGYLIFLFVLQRNRIALFFWNRSNRQSEGRRDKPLPPP